MKEIKDKLKDINQAWESYFWNYGFCKAEINFETQGKINYYADIFNYLKDTLPFIDEVKYFPDFNKSVFQATGIMQTIYAQQDLINEILYIFKLQASSQEDKNPNRKIRNELIGHPIRRKPVGRELISSIFLGRYFSNGMINYILYSVDHNFVGKDTYHRLDEIIERHKRFLNKYLTLIWNKVTTVLVRFKKGLTELKRIVDLKVPFKRILDIVEHRFEAIFKTETIFKKEGLLYFLDNLSTHARYRHSISLFAKSLSDSLTESIDTINQLIGNKEKNRKDKLDATNELVTFNVNIIDENHTDFIFDSKDHLGYEFSKLFDKHPIYNIEHFKSEFQDIEILQELNNMELNFENDLEYYCSYEYLRKLLTDKGFL